MSKNIFISTFVLFHKWILYIQLSTFAMKKKKSSFIKELTRVIKLENPPLKENIHCILGSADGCSNPKKCNRKNACNESLKPFF
jgi:hypothetical protein